MATVLEELPFVNVVWDSYVDVICHYCCLRRPDLSRCSKCKFAHYCGKDCQKNAWPDHVQECKGLARMYPRVAHPRARLMARVLTKLKNDPQQMEASSTDGKRTFAMLMSHKDEIRKDDRRMKNFEQEFRELRELLSPNYWPSIEDDALEIYGKLEINSFTMVAGCPEFPYATGLYLEMSCLDHSCDPDAVVVFSGCKMILNLVKNRETWKEIDYRTLRIAYLDTYNSSAMRRDVLMDRYYFECKCDRCQSDEILVETALKCSDQNCDGMVAMVDNSEVGRCESCGVETSTEMGIWATLCSRDVREAMERREVSEVLEGFKSIADTIDDVSKYAHPFNIHFGRLVHDAIRCLYDQKERMCREQIDWFLKYHEVFFRGFRHYHSTHSPELTDMLVSLGDFMAFIRELDRAATYYGMAITEAMITHGESHEICDELRRKFDSVHMR